MLCRNVRVWGRGLNTTRSGILSKFYRNGKWKPALFAICPKFSGDIVFTVKYDIVTQTRPWTNAIVLLCDGVSRYIEGGEGDSLLAAGLVELFTRDSNEPENKVNFAFSTTN